MRALGYIRVSTSEQATEGTSLEVQTDALLRDARRRGWEIEIVSDAGISAAGGDQKSLKAALASLDDGSHDVLMVTRLDRLTRSVAGLGAILARAQANQWELVLLSPGIDTTEPAGRFTTSILACAAQYERDLISQRTREALAHRRSQGGSLGRPRNVDAGVVERIKQQRAHKKSLRAIAEQLNAEGVPTAQGGARWHASTVSAVLKSYEDQ
ncbi:DNA invertase Pin-like site-specific DNA recombinase [Luteococcus japonicus]|uniref:DNA invertase Pin-like site-specific DNA recombinase n=1 Tax=Luteococcus japonicus TaxID=33984 RepID=A0A3N1ZRI7_9ACTN|nr:MULTISPECIES: recombinase family protein [Luteococcus]MDN5563322.1 recombinase family protein [Luteococcus sp.]ROR53338.1 DNA invertase Pin-like site-specific DNA recombinase [Luteococcus japonicus]